MDVKRDTDLKMPAFATQYIVPTLDGHGTCTSYIDEYAQKFIDYAASKEDPVLEIGATYGFVTIEALKAGAKVIANDLDPRHLDILYAQTPEQYRKNLRLLPGEFPKDFFLDDDSLSGCYMGHVMGYISPVNLQVGFEKLYRWLKNDSLLFITSATIYMSFFRDFIEIYEQRVRDNDKWPGYFTNLKRLINERIPNTLHFCDERVLTRELERVGFIVEQVELYPRRDLPERSLWDGREGLGAIARKP